MTQKPEVAVLDKAIAAAEKSARSLQQSDLLENDGAYQAFCVQRTRVRAFKTMRTVALQHFNDTNWDDACMIHVTVFNDATFMQECLVALRLLRAV